MVDETRAEHREGIVALKHGRSGSAFPKEPEGNVRRPGGNFNGKPCLTSRSGNHRAACVNLKGQGGKKRWGLDAHCVAPERQVQVLTLGDCECDPIWARVFADIINNLKTESPWINWVGTKSGDRCPSKKRRTQGGNWRQRPE